MSIQCSEKLTADNFNITAIGNKMTGLFFITATNIDILLNLESKLDKSFSGYSEPCQTSKI